MWLKLYFDDFHVLCVLCEGHGNSVRISSSKIAKRLGGVMGSRRLLVLLTRPDGRRYTIHDDLYSDGYPKIGTQVTWIGK